jgi:hypothetical protein
VEPLEPGGQAVGVTLELLVVTTLVLQELQTQAAVVVVHPD